MNKIKAFLLLLILSFLNMPVYAYDNKHVDQLLEQLKNDDYNIRRAAAKELKGVTSDNRAFNALIDALKDADKDVRSFAAYDLAWFFDSRAIGPLINALKDKDKDVRCNAADALGVMKNVHSIELAVEPLISLLQDGYYDVRFTTATSLGELKDRRAVEPLIAALKDENKDVRSCAAIALGILEDKRAIAPLATNLLDWDSHRQVAQALSKLGWIPSSEEEKIHFWIAEGSGEEIKKHWALAQSIMLKDLESESNRCIENALYAFIALGNKDIIPLLTDTLSKKGNKLMAEVYLNSGQNDLVAAARDWGVKNGFVISTGIGSSPVQWKSW
jgi:HEAT repeat protein